MGLEQTVLAEFSPLPPSTCRAASDMIKAKIWDNKTQAMPKAWCPLFIDESRCSKNSFWGFLSQYIKSALWVLSTIETIKRIELFVSAS